jgi:hypothetical protein
MGNFCDEGDRPELLRLVRRLPAWRRHLAASLRVRAGIAQPLTEVVGQIGVGQRQPKFATDRFWRLGRVRGHHSAGCCSYVEKRATV